MSDPAKLKHPPARAVEALEVIPVEQPPPPPKRRPPDAVPQVIPVDLVTVPPVGSVELPRERERGLLGWLWAFLVRFVFGVASILEWLFGALTLIVMLSVLAAIPVLQFFSLGYMLEASARIARTGRIRDGFPGVRIAARLGGLVIGIFLMQLPIWLVSSLSQSAQLIDPDSIVARRWRMGLIVLTVVMAVHIVLAVACGGRLRNFLLPFINPFLLVSRLRHGGYYRGACNGVWDFVMAMRLRHYFWLGLRGFAGGMIWLAPPITLLAMGTWVPRIGPLFGWFGALLLIIVLSYVPIVQVRFATENRFACFFEFWAARRTFHRAPWTFSLAYVLTLAFALPLYLLKIETVPSETAWIPSLFFIVFMFPARLLFGWAYGFAIRCPKPYRNWFFRWTGWVWIPPATAFYVLILYFTQFTGWHGVWGLYEQHAFLLPVPFVGM